MLTLMEVPDRRLQLTHRYTALRLWYSKQAYRKKTLWK